jgi:hypothetical protein
MILFFSTTLTTTSQRSGSDEKVEFYKYLSGTAAHPVIMHAGENTKDGVNKQKPQRFYLH